MFQLPIADAGVLNDLCVAGSNGLYISDSCIGKIFLVNLNTKTYRFIGRIAGANRLTFFAPMNQLFACSMGDSGSKEGGLFAKNISRKNTLFTPLANTPTGIFDGLEMIDSSHLIVTDWVDTTGTKDRAWIYDLKNHQASGYFTDAGPADLFYDAASHTYFIPQMLKNVILTGRPENLKNE